MAFGLTELGRQERFDKVPGDGRTHCSAAQTNNVHVIILDPLPGGEVIADQTGSNAGNLVGAD